MNRGFNEIYVRQIRKPLLKYAFALAMAAVAIGLRFALNPLTGPGYQYVTVFPVIMVVAILAGRGPAILHAFLAGTLATYYFSPDYHAGAFISTIIVYSTGFIVGGLAQKLHNALAQTHKRSEELAESEQKFRLLADSAQAVIGIVQGEKFVYVNPYIEKLSGYTTQEIIDIELWKLIHPEDRKKVLDRARRRQAGERVEKQYEFRMLTKTGKTRWLDFSPVLITYHGRPAIAGIAFDITARKRIEEELRQAHGLMQGITQSTSVLIAAIDDEFRFLFFNDAYQWEFKKLWGIDIEKGTSLLEALAAWPEQQKKAEKLWNRALMGESFTVISEFGPSDENAGIFDIRFNPVYDDQGRNIGAAHILRDITEQIRIQRQLRESELFYRQTLESIPGMVFTTRPDGYCDFQSSQWVEYTGVPMEQMLGDGWNKLLHPEDRERAFTAWRAAVEGTADYDLEYRVRRYNGRYEWFKARARPIRDAAGQIVRWFGVAANISDLKKAQEDLAASEVRFRGTFENAAVGMTLVDLEGNWIAANRKFCDQVGYSWQALKGTDFLVLTHPDDIEIDRQQFAELREGRLDSYFVEKRYVRRDGSIMWVDLYRAVQRDANGKPVYTIAVVIDINDRKLAEEALRRSEERLRAVFEYVGVGIIEVEENDRIVNVNRQVCDVVKRSRDQLLGMTIHELTWPADRDTSDRLNAELHTQRRDRVDYEKRYLRGDGSPVWVHVTVSPIIDAGGRWIRSVGTIEDITQRKQAQEALRQSEEQFHSMFDRHGAVKLVIDPETGAICDANQAAVQFYGYSRQQLCTMRIQDINQLAEDEIAAERRRAVAEERNYFVFPHRLADGTVRTVEVYSTVVPIGGKKRLYSIIHDITERRQAEEALRQSERRFRELADSMPQIVWAARPDGVVDYFNRKWAEVTEGDLTRIGDEGWIPALHPDDVQRVKDTWYRSIRTGSEYAAELRLKVRDRNEYRWYIARALPIRDESGSIVRWFGTATDVDELKQTQETLAQLKADLENKNKEMESIIGIVSHDLRAPLVNIQGFTHEIKTDCKALDTMLARVPVEQKVEKQLDKLLHHNIPESLQYIQASSEAMNNLVRTLVEVARAGLAPIKPETINMSELLTQIVQNLKIKFKEANVVYDVILPLPDCFADRTQVTQIFTNLLDNAVKYLDPSRSGQICVEGTPQADGVLYWVSDNGIGIPPDQQEKIFEPYYQLKEKASGGIGMGLATVKKLIDRNNGKIWVVSEKSKYSIFYVALPKPPPADQDS